MRHFTYFNIGGTPRDALPTPCKQAYFAPQTRLLCAANKAPLHAKQGFFADGAECSVGQITLFNKEILKRKCCFHAAHYLCNIKILEIRIKKDKLLTGGRQKGLSGVIKFYFCPTLLHLNNNIMYNNQKSKNNMRKTQDTRRAHFCATPRAVTDEQVAMARRHMTAAFIDVMAHPSSNNLYWMGTQTDLVEIVYTIWTMGIMHHADGTPCRLAWLVRRACAVLHTPEPANPSMVAKKALRRKGVRQMTMTERYAWQKYVAGIESPLGLEIKCPEQ